MDNMTTEPTILLEGEPTEFVQHGQTFTRQTLLIAGHWAAEAGLPLVLVNRVVGMGTTMEAVVAIVDSQASAEALIAQEGDQLGALEATLSAALIGDAQ
jgi:hypothetical protein